MDRIHLYYFNRDNNQLVYQDNKTNPHTEGKVEEIFTYYQKEIGC